MINYGDVAVNSKLYIPFATYDKDDGSSITLAALAVSDIRVYKNGIATVRSSTSGYALLDTDGRDFDSITGVHGFSIDLSDNTDAGFYAAGNDYFVIVKALTVDAVVVSLIAAQFSIEKTGCAIALLKNATYGLSALNTILSHTTYGLSALKAILDLMEGATFNTLTDSLEAIRNRGDVAWLTGGLSGSNTVTITIKDGAGLNIPDVFVEIWDALGTTFYEKKITNSLGQTIHYMDDGGYTVRIHKAGYTFSLGALTVSGVTAATYTGTAWTISNPAVVGACRVYDFAFMPDGSTPVSEIVAKAKIVSLPANYNGILHSGDEIDAVYNSSTGVFYWDIVKGSSVEFIVPSFGINAYLKTIPATDTARLITIV